MKFQKGAVSFVDGLSWILPLIAIFGCVGWVWNIFKILGTDGFSGLLVGRVVGVFIAPLGAVLGYF